MYYSLWAVESPCIHWYAVLGEILAWSFSGAPLFGATVQYCAVIHNNFLQDGQDWPKHNYCKTNLEVATCSSCAPDGSRESVKCQVRQEACVPSWNNQLHYCKTVQFNDRKV